MRGRLPAIIGAAFCAGALTAVWAERPWERARAADVEHATPESPGDGPMGPVGTYGESSGGASEAPSDSAVAPARPSGSGVMAGTHPAPVPPLPADVLDASGVPVDLRARRLLMPVKGVNPSELQPTFHAPRGTGEHEALDILAPRGTPVLAVEDGVIAKLFFSARGGNTIYQFERSGRYCYYYAHLDSYANGLAPGQSVSRGQVLGYVGSTGNADANAPHLHFAIFKLGPEKRWWQGTPIDPYPVLKGS